MRRQTVQWQHRIGEVVPARIPHPDNSVHELLLEGTANLPPDVSNMAALIAEAYRVLRPGGEIRVHGLGGSKAMSKPLPELPGPAVVVRHVPTWREVAEQLSTIGFASVRFETLSAKAHFTVADVELREFMLVAQKPGHRPVSPTHSAVYLGPLAVVTDDFGNVFYRGEVVALNIHDWQALSKNSAQGQFLLCSPP
jgi:hypothetical protein